MVTNKFSTLAQNLFSSKTDLDEALPDMNPVPEEACAEIQQRVRERQEIIIVRKMKRRWDTVNTIVRTSSSPCLFSFVSEDKTRRDKERNLCLQKVRTMRREMIDEGNEDNEGNAVESDDDDKTPNIEDDYGSYILEGTPCVVSWHS